MFDLLRTADSRVATDAAYRVSLRIREREHFPDWRMWLALRPDHRSPPGAIELATRVLDEIECRSGKPLSALSEEALRPYLRRMDDLLDARWEVEAPDPEGVGARILAEMRRDYGSPERAAA